MLKKALWQIVAFSLIAAPIVTEYILKIKDAYWD